MRVWSVACATGEEPYSLALLACEAFASTHAARAHPRDRHLVRRARASRPRAATATALGAGRRGAAAIALSRARRRPARGRSRRSASSSTLAPHNLVSDPYPPLGEAPFHLILCRNVLIYFDSETCARVVAGLERALAPGGRLVLGAADALCVLDRAVGELHAGRRKSEAPRHRPRERRPRPRGPLLPSRRLRPADEDPMDPDVHYLHGLAELESGDAAAAVSSLRRVLYLDPGFELAAFALGRAHEKAGDPDAARRRYEQALRMLGVRPEPGERLAGPIDAATVIDACEARLAGDPGRPAMSPVSVLLVDDSPSQRAVITHRLEQGGFEVATATDGQDCLRVLGELRPDIVLLDVVMPGIDGWETLDRIRRPTACP